MQSKINNLAPGKIGVHINIASSARYTGNVRVPSGSSYSYLNYLNNFMNSNNSAYPVQNSLKFYQCGKANCKTCPRANAMQIDNNNKNNQKFCKVYNCIYKISCSDCKNTYIGQTKNPLHIRINLHRSNINNYLNTGNHLDSFNAEFHHFSMHDFDSSTIEILAIKQNTEERLFYENKFITDINSIYPYGLNQIAYNKVLFNDNVKNDSIVYNFLNKININKTTRTTRGKGKSKNKQKITSNSVLKNEIIDLEKHYLIDYDWKIVRKWIFAVKKKQIHNIYNIFQNLKLNQQFTHLCIDLFKARAHKLNTPLIKTKIIQNSNVKRCIITYTNNKLNNIKFNDIFKKTIKYFPIKEINITKTFKYNNTIGRKIFNYNKIAKNIHSSDTTCYCNKPEYAKYVNKDLGHIITGDLNIISNKCLRTLMEYGTKFRLPYFHNNKQLITQFAKDLDIFIYKTAIKYNHPIEAFNVWKFNILKIFDTYIKKYNFNKGLPTLKSLNKHIQKIKDEFVITYIDKAANNFSIICRKLYVDKLIECIEKMKLKRVNDNLTTNNKKILAVHKLLNLKHDNLNYPYIVIIPKFHKTPIAFRTVTIGCNAYNNIASKKLLSILTILYNHITNNHHSVSIKNSGQIVNKLNSLTYINHINTYDFKDLFNNINLKNLVNVINILYNQYSFLFNNITKNFFKKLLNFIVLNNYFYIDNVIYIQTVGVPQGGSCSSILANLYLSYYEQHIDNDNRNSKIFRYIDDIIAINTFMSNNNNDNNTDFSFYPNELELIKSSNNNTINYLDLNIKIINNKPIINLYDKKQNFNFNTISIINYKSCLHINVYKNILINQVNRIKNLCHPTLITNNLKKLYTLAVDNNYPVGLVNYIFKEYNLT